MFNTTTIPTQHETPANLLYVFYILSLGMMIGGSMFELFLHRLREKEQLNKIEVENDVEEDKYCNKYDTEFDALAIRPLSDDELIQLNTKFVREEVAPKVEVVLTFDKETDTFCYYTDKLKDVSYDILETVARKFVIDYDCKVIYSQTEQELALAQESLAQKAQAQAEQAQAQEAQAPAQAEQAPAQAEQAQAPDTLENKPSVFAKFKDYNTGGKGSPPNFASVIKVIEQMNHFRYKGKLSDYEATLKEKESIKDNEPLLDYATYKKLLEKKEK